MSAFVLDTGLSAPAAVFLLTTGKGTYTTLSSEYGSYTSGTEEAEVRSR